MTSEEASTSSRAAADASAVADALGERLAALIDEPEAFVEALEHGLSELSAPAHAVTLRRLSPDVVSPYAVRAPLVRIVEARLRPALRLASSATALWLAAQLEGSLIREVRMFARPCLLRALPDEPERTWQLMRRLAAGAGDWIEVDALAQVWARGILAESFRWAELEQLVFSRSVLERRLVGATLATLPHELPREGRAERASELAPRAIELVGALIGDAEPIVQQALSWALRSWYPLVPGAVEAFLRQQSDTASAQVDGHRAWVVRDTLPVTPAALAIELRRRVRDVRRRRDAPSSSRAAAIAARYGVGEAAGVAGRQGDRYARARA